MRQGGLFSYKIGVLAAKSSQISRLTERPMLSIILVLSKNIIQGESGLMTGNLENTGRLQPRYAERWQPIHGKTGFADR